MVKPYHREDLLLLNIYWLYKAGIFTTIQLVEFIDKTRHSFEAIQKGEIPKDDIVDDIENGIKDVKKRKKREWQPEKINYYKEYEPEIKKPLGREVGRSNKIDDKEIIKKILKLNSYGLSSRKINNVLLKEDDIEIHYNTILNIINKATEKIEGEKKEKQKPKLEDENEKYLRLVEDMSKLDLTPEEFLSSGTKTNPNDVPNSIEMEEEDEPKDE